MSKFCIIQGEIEKIEEYTSSASNVFGLGDKIHESVRLYNTYPLFLKEHIMNMQDTMDVLGIPYPKDFSVDNITKQISRLLNVNKVYKGGHCKIVVYRNAGVFDALEVFESRYAIFIEHLPKLEFEFNALGKRLALLQSAIIEKPHLYSMYSAHMLVQNKSNAIIKKAKVSAIAYFNTQGNIFHTSAGDLFYVKDDVVYCPSSDINTFRHPLTDFLIQLLKKKSIKVLDESIVISERVLESDEIFLVHPIFGIQWVVNCNEKTYGFSLAGKAHNFLEQELRATF